MRTVGAVFDVVVVLLYPLIVVLGLNYLNVRWTALLLLVLLGRRFLVTALSQRSTSLVILVQVVAMGAIISAAAVSGSEVVLRYTPFAISLTFLAQFALSLKGTPLVERFARLKKPELLPDEAAYCRRLTRTWVVVLGGNSVLMLFAATFADPWLWALLVGVVGYLYLGLFFAAEYAYRKRRFQDFDAKNPIDRALKLLLQRRSSR